MDAAIICFLLDLISKDKAHSVENASTKTTSAKKHYILKFALKALQGITGKKPRSERVDPIVINIPKIPENLSVEVTNSPTVEPKEALQAVKHVENIVTKATDVKIQGGGEIKRPSILKVSKRTWTMSPFDEIFWHQKISSNGGNCSLFGFPLVSSPPWFTDFFSA